MRTTSLSCNRESRRGVTASAVVAFLAIMSCTNGCAPGGLLLMPSSDGPPMSAIATMAGATPTPGSAPHSVPVAETSPAPLAPLPGPYPSMVASVPPSIEVPAPNLQQQIPAALMSGSLNEPPPPPEELASERTIQRIPIHAPVNTENIQFRRDQDRISLNARDASLNVLLGIIAEQHGLNVIAGEDVNQRISVKMTNVRLADALDAILSFNGYVWTQHNNILMVSKVSAENRVAPSLQGREVRVFSLNYVTADDVDKVAQGLLSPVGQSFINASVPTDHRRTQEQIVVEDLPFYLQRIEQYIAEVDRPPRQVLVEAHVLQVQLKSDCRHGVDFENILRIAGADVTLATNGFANGNGPGGVITIEGTDLDAVIEAIKNTTDAKTLASPKVAVLNGQQARIQVGGQIGYLLTTTTQTSTLQSVNFLDLGVILQVTPVITADNQILMQVQPQVSTGRINATTQLPESETTQLETRIMLADGEAMLIGGLIKETDIDTQSKVGWLGDLAAVGRLFQRRETTRERNEIIITLVPRIVPDVPCARNLNPSQVDQAGTPLLQGPLQQVDRRVWESQLPDAGRHNHQYQDHHNHSSQHLCGPNCQSRQNMSSK